MNKRLGTICDVVGAMGAAVMLSPPLALVGFLAIAHYTDCTVRYVENRFKPNEPIACHQVYQYKNLDCSKTKR